MLLRWGRGGTAAPPSPGLLVLLVLCPDTLSSWPLPPFRSALRPGPPGLYLHHPGRCPRAAAANVPGQPPPMGAVRPFVGGPPLGAVPWLPLITLVSLAAAESVLNGG